MPMAGLGKRFLNSQFKAPKPLIEINNNPMFIESAKSMPNSNLNIFVCHEDLINKYKIKKILDLNYPKKYEIITVDKTTEGQANTCFLAEKFINEDDKIFIHSCDSFIQFKTDVFDKKLKSNDAIIFTTKPNNQHLSKINSYGWVHKKNNKILKITCKKKASENPNLDEVIIGSFAFKNKNVFIKSLKSLFDKKIKVNNEYYMDMAINETIKLNFNVTFLSVDSYLSWGTPEELFNWKNENKHRKI